ncbi:hypothetical protein [Mangrovimonas sp. DI 80]|uniref:hypothetical protein n=1 Tax=Mangrovimonas sp. DI 80 TaxID=1779330 RepID=UPI000975B5E6|nr:hypothetical protein [Mangrovimonas sp. DI 80]OMP30473.1 hypothetical protein BKM32_13950 [Mangrovimonas sp. DI 80]
MNKITRDFIQQYYNSGFDEESDNLKSIFEDVFDLFITEHYDEEYNTLFCNIHNNFHKGHNCVACNLNESNLRIENFLIQYRNFNDIHLTFTNFILLLYLQVESIYEYFDIIQLQESYKSKHFRVFQDVKRWANFLKHPKSFMLVHHPSWTYEGRKVRIEIDSEELIDEIIKRTNPTIDSNFVNVFYAGDKKNKELFKKLNKKEDVLICFPNPIQLIKEFTKAQKKFTEIIANN